MIFGYTLFFLTIGSMKQYPSQKNNEILQVFKMNCIFV